MSNPLLSVENIETYYGPIMAIRGISFKVNQGSIVTILGSNGAGKTTILKTISGAIDPDFEDANEKFVDVPLIKVAYGRSGDKGNKANIGIISRDPKFYPAICNFLDEKVVKDCFADFLEGSVERYFLPGSNSINFILNDVLGGGGPASLRNDPQGKAYAQILLDQMIPIPEKLLS